MPFSTLSGQDDLMTADGRTARQLQTIGWLNRLLAEQGIDYWLFGGWAVDFHAGRLTRRHEDVDLAIWQSDLEHVTTLLQAHGWAHAPEPGEDGYTGYERGDVRVELALLARDEAGTVYTPLTDGRGAWPAGSFRDDEAELEGVRARVVDLGSLIEDKSGSRDDPTATAKDRADVAVLAPLSSIR
jgi:Aminoglycoside-2''-adenylyltransferase